MPRLTGTTRTRMGTGRRRLMAAATAPISAPALTVLATRTAPTAG